MRMRMLPPTKIIIGIWPLFCFQNPPYPIFKITYTKVIYQNLSSIFFLSRLSPILGICTPPNPVENVPFDGRIRWQTEGVQKAQGPSRYRLPGNGE